MGRGHYHDNGWFEALAERLREVGPHFPEVRQLRIDVGETGEAFPAIILEADPAAMRRPRQFRSRFGIRLVNAELFGDRTRLPGPWCVHLVRSRSSWLRLVGEAVYVRPGFVPAEVSRG